MNEIISKLTPEQEKGIPKTRDKWIAIVQSEDNSATEKEIATTIVDVYETCGLKAPREVQVVSSPTECIRVSKQDANYADFGYGNHDGAWLSFYDFFLEYCNLTCCEKAIPLIKLAKQAHWYLAYDEVCIVSRKPKIFRKEGVLHREDGPAIEYPDGVGVYLLNDVRVTKEIVMTPVEKFTKEMIIGEVNVEVRREVVAKVGIDRAMKLLGGSRIDKKTIAGNEYELIDIDLMEETYTPFLRMKNPSIDTWHIEGVHPSCRTIEEALEYRNGIKGTPIVLT